eukprot:4027168-Lingulodinium_polyedra.AAC.1
MGFWPASDSTVGGYRSALGRPHALVSLGKSLALAPLRWHPSFTCPRSSSGCAAVHDAGTLGHSSDTCGM